MEPNGDGAPTPAPAPGPVVAERQSSVDGSRCDCPFRGLPAAVEWFSICAADDRSKRGAEKMEKRGIVHVQTIVRTHLRTHLYLYTEVF